MSSKFEVWLCDDYGRRKYLFEKFSSLSYTRTTAGLGTCNLLLPYDKFLKDVGSIPKRDMRIDVWRSPYSGIAARREGSFLIRKPMIYQRTTDQVRMIDIFGRSPLDLLRRQNSKTNATITDTIDNIMKTIVRSRFVTNLTAYSTSPNTFNGSTYTSTGEFVVDEDADDGPTITAPASYYLRSVLDICQDLKSASLLKNESDDANKKIYFDVIEDDSAGLHGGFGYRFRTYPDMRGKDRTNGIIYSTENGNLQSPVYYEDGIDEYTSSFFYNASAAWGSVNVQNNNQYQSRWNYIESAQTTSETEATGAITNAQSDLRDKSAKKVLNADFLNSPGSPTQPRALYGVDWDLGDILPVKFAGQVLSAGVAIVYVGLNENGKESITGKTSVGV